MLLNGNLAHTTYLGLLFRMWYSSASEIPVLKHDIRNVHCIYGQASGVPGPPPPMVWSGIGGGGWRVRSVVWPVGWGAAVGGQGSQRGPGSYASPTQAINLITWGVFLFSLTLTCTTAESLKQSINRHPNQPTPQTLPKLLSTLGLITLLNPKLKSLS